MRKDIVGRVKRRIKKRNGKSGMVLLYVYDRSPGYFCVTAHGVPAAGYLLKSLLHQKCSCIGGQGRRLDYENGPAETRSPA